MNRFGQSVLRVEDARYLRGRGRYVDDIALHGMAFAAVLRSPHAHARLRHVDVTAARAAPRVLAVLTGQDAVADGIGGLGIRRVPPGFGGPKAFWPMRPILAIDRARHVGDGVVLVVAETLSSARDAAELIDVDYDILACAASVGDAVKDGAVPIWSEAEGNICFAYELGNKQVTDAAFARAAHVVRLSVVNNRVSANSLEPRGAIGAYDELSGRYTLYSSTQAPHRTREVLCETVFRIPETAMRVIGPDVGGGFGMKGPVYPEEALVLWAARRVGRPVKWIAERSEGLMSDTHGRDQEWIGEAAFDFGGLMIGVRVSADHNMGGYVSNNAHIPAMLSGSVLPNVYTCRNFHVSFRGLFTNTPPTGPYRGAGQPEAVFMIEQLLDRGAAEMGIDRLEVRRRNFIAAENLPYRTPTGQNYDSGEFEALMDKAIKLADWRGFESRRAESRKRGLLRGIGLCSFIELTAFHNERMEIRFDPSGSATIVCGTFSHGQGHETVYAQILSDWLGLPFESIRIIQGDTDRVAYGRGTYASRSMSVGGASLRFAADQVIQKARQIAAHLLEAAADDIDFTDGKFTVSGTDRGIDLASLARATYAAASHWPQELGVGLEGVGGFTPLAPTYPNGCHICEVEVDPDTGQVQIVRYCAVDDIGRAINPLLLQGQVHGGVAQGIGQSIKECVVFDPDSAQILSGSFMDYAMPRASDFPSIAVGLHDVPCLTNPIGVKGAGEAGCVGAPPAVIGAIVDALRANGVTEIAMPATPERVWRAIRSAVT